MTSELARSVEHGWSVHAEEPRAVAATLREHAATLAPDADAAAAIDLGAHVMLAHLHDPAALAAWLDALPAALAHEPAPTAQPLQRARWALRRLADDEDEDDPALPDALRWRALQNVWAVLVARGQAARAQAQLGADEPRALGHADPAATRALAATCNNTALELRSGPRGDAARDALMLAAASASRRLWRAVGTWVHVERADYQLARCHAVLGHGEPALAHARACRDALQAHAGAPEADAFEWCYAHEALAWAQLAAGDGAGARAERAQMAQRLASVTDPGSRGWAAADLAALDQALRP